MESITNQPRHRVAIGLLGQRGQCPDEKEATIFQTQARGLNASGTQISEKGGGGVTMKGTAKRIKGGEKGCLKREEKKSKGKRRSGRKGKRMVGNWSGR